MIQLLQDVIYFAGELVDSVQLCKIYELSLQHSVRKWQLYLSAYKYRKIYYWRNCVSYFDKFDIIASD